MRRHDIAQVLVDRLNTRPIAVLNEQNTRLRKSLDRLNGIEDAQHGLLDCGGTSFRPGEDRLGFGSLSLAQREDRAANQQKRQQAPTAIGD